MTESKAYKSVMMPPAVHRNLPGWSEHLSVGRSLMIA